MTRFFFFFFFSFFCPEHFHPQHLQANVVAAKGSAITVGGEGFRCLEVLFQSRSMGMKARSCPQELQL